MAQLWYLRYTMVLLHLEHIKPDPPSKQYSNLYNVVVIVFFKTVHGQFLSFKVTFRFNIKTTMIRLYLI